MSKKPIPQWQEMYTWPADQMLSWMKSVGCSVSLHEGNDGWSCSANLATPTHNYSFGTSYHFKASANDTSCRTAVLRVCHVVWAGAYSQVSGFNEQDRSERSDYPCI